MATDTLAVPTQRRWRGILPWLSHLLVGDMDEAQLAAQAAEDEVKKLANHGAGFMTLARFLSRPLMIIFSIGALNVLAGPAIQHVYLALTGKAPLDINEVASLVVILSLIVAADIAMIVAAVLVQDAWQRHVWNGVDRFAAGVLGGVALMEAATLFIMIVNVEHPRYWWDWLLAGLRSLMAPVVAVFLALLYPRTPSDADFKQVLAMRTYGLLLGRIKRGEIADDDMGLLYHMAAIATGISEQAQAQMQELIAAFREATPEYIRKESDALLAQREAHWQAEMVKMQAAYQQQLSQHSARYQQQSSQHTSENERLIERVNHLQAQVEEVRIQADSELGNTLKNVLLSLAYQHTIPADIAERFPDIAALDVEGMFQQSRRNTRGNPSTKAAQESPNSAEGKRAFLEHLAPNMEPKKLHCTPDGRKGVWVLPAAVVALSGNKVSDDEARSIVRSKSRDVKHGTSYVAPFDDVMDHLSRVHLLGDRARNFWSSAEDGQEEGVALRVVQ